MELILKTLLILLKLIGYISTPILSFLNKIYYKPRPFPPLKNDLLTITVIDLAYQIRNRQISSLDVVNAYIDRLKEVNPIINAIITDRFEEAIEDAKTADKIADEMTPSETLKKYPLLGVPFTVKENCSLKGMSIAMGTKHLLGMTATKDGTAVANLIKAGAIPLLISNTPIYCMDWDTRNYVTGTTLNPHDLSRSVGGSSGGEGALVTSGASLFGVGSDLGGSIRIPSHFNGVFGHKPSGGLIPNDGVLPESKSEGFKDINTVGPMCRYATDMPLLVQIMAGVNAEKLRFNEVVDLNKVKIFFMENPPPTFAGIPVQTEICESMQMAVQYLKRKGFDIKEAPYFPLLKERIEIGLATFLIGNDFPPMLQNPKNPTKMHNLCWEIIKSLFGMSDYTLTPLIIATVLGNEKMLSKDKIPVYLRKGEELREQLIDLLGDNGVLLWPTWPLSAQTQSNSSVTLSAALTYTFPFNWLKFPATHVPLGKDDNALPIGIQIIGAPMQDRLTLAIAQELEIGFNGWVKPFAD